MKQIGKVESAKNDEAVVIINRSGMCGENCASCRASCTPTKHRVRAKNPVGAKPGNTVMVEMSDGKVLAGAALLYLFPLAAMIGGYFFADYLWHSEPVSIIAAAVCLSLAFIFAKIVDRALTKTGKYQSTISKILR